MCPLCSSSCAYILQDKYRQGQWHSCTGCGFNGDLITLASKCLQLSILATIHRLQSYGICSSEQNALESAQALIAENAEIETSRTVLAKAGQNALQARSKHAPLLRALRINPKYIAASADQSRWLGGPIDVEESNITAKPNQLFILPIYDMPGRITAWLHFGGHCKTPKTWSTKYYPLTGDGGLYYHPKIRDSLRGQDRAVLAMPDCTMAYRVLLRGLLASPEPIPIVGYAGKHNDDSWELFNDCKRVIWSPKPTMEQIARAILCNGWVSQSYPRDVYDQMAKNTPADNYRAFVRSAIPWQEALNEFVESRLDSEIETLLREVLSYGVLLEIVEQALAPEQRERCRNILNIRVQNYVQVEQFKVTEINEQLYILDKGGMLRCVSDVIPKISKLVAFPTAPWPTLCLGSVQYKKQTVATVMPFAKLRLAYKDYVQEACVKAGLGLPHIDETRCWLFDIALSLSRPEVEKGIPSEGWNEQSQSLAIAKYRIGKSETVELGYDLPGKNPDSVYLPFPRTVMPHEFAELAEPTIANQLLWKCFTFVAANVLAPMAGEQSINAVMYGYRRYPVTLLQKLNCITLSAWHMNPRGVWPVVADRWATSRYDVEQIVDVAEGRFGVAVKLKKKLLARDYLHLAVERRDKPSLKSIRKIQELLPCYLENAVRRGADFKHTGLWAKRVADDIRDWVRIETHGKLELPI